MDVNSVINNLSEKLGVTAEYILPVMTRAKFTEGIMGVTVTLVILFFIAYFALTKLKCLTFEKLEDMDSDLAGCYIVGALIGFVVFVILLVLLPVQLQKILNPEYYAIKEVLELLRVVK